MNFTSRAEEALGMAAREAGGGPVTSNHLLQGLLRCPRICSILTQGGTQPVDVFSESLSPRDNPEYRERGYLPKEIKAGIDARPEGLEVAQSALYVTIKEMAEASAKQEGLEEVDSDHLLLAMAQTQGSLGELALSKCGLTTEKIKSMIHSHDMDLRKEFEASKQARAERAASDLAKVQAQIKRHETKEARSLFDRACGSLSTYLGYMGWEMTLDFSGWKDPLTGDVLPSSDMAFARETDRYRYLTLERQLSATKQP